MRVRVRVTACDVQRPLPTRPMPDRSQLPQEYLLHSREDAILDPPALEEAHHFVNLSNGVEAVPILRNLNLNLAGFLRIQSTACEQFHTKYAQILDECDASLLIRLALDEPCYVWDFGSRNPESGVPRALWYGLEWVRFACARSWGLAPSECKHRDDALPRALLRGKDVRSTFEDRFRALPQRTARKLRYYRRFRCDPTVNPDDPQPTPPGQMRVPLYGVYGATDRDNDAAFFVDIMRRCSSGTLEMDGDDDDDDAKSDVERLRQHGLALWMGGVSHSERDLILDSQM